MHNHLKTHQTSVVTKIKSKVRALNMKKMTPLRDIESALDILNPFLLKDKSIHF